MKITAWRAWGAFRDDTGELLMAAPDKYVAKHAAMNFEQEHSVPCSHKEVKVTTR